MNDVHLTPAEKRLLARVATDDVTYRLIGSGARGYTYRLWLNEDHYRTVTARVKGLMVKRLVKHGWGWQYGAGPMELTDAGRGHIGTTVNPSDTTDQGQ